MLVSRQTVQCVRRYPNACYCAVGRLSLWTVPCLYAQRMRNLQPGISQATPNPFGLKCGYQISGKARKNSIREVNTESASGFQRDIPRSAK